MKSSELERWLRKHGCSFQNHKGGSGHRTVQLGDRVSQLPIHGANKELPRRLVEKIKKDLGLK